MKPIAEHWEDYQRMVVPPDAPAEQVTECRRAFYAGAHAAYIAALSIGADDISEEQGEEILRAIDAELGVFVKDVDGGRA